MNIEYHDKKAPRKFKFEIVWAEMEECGEVIRKGWEYKGQGSRMFKLVQKLKGCRKKLKEWSREAVPNNRKMIDELTRRVADIQGGDDMEGRFEEYREVMAKIKEVWEKEEKYWYQRSRVKWMEFGDKNTRYFHQVTRQRRQINKVVRIKERDGEWIEEEDLVRGRFEDYYRELFSTGGGCWSMYLRWLRRMLIRSW